MPKSQKHFENVNRTLENMRRKVLCARRAKQPDFLFQNKKSNIAFGTDSTSTRLKKEFMDITVDPPPLCSARLKNNNLHEWEATLKGPPNSVYKGGVFHLSINFPKEYPIKPPVVKFTTRIYHCNVNVNGSICLGVLNREWRPEMTVSSVLLSVCALLTDCNPNDALVASIACLYFKNRKEHDRLAREFTKKYASEEFALSAARRDDDD